MSYPTLLLNLEDSSVRSSNDYDEVWLMMNLPSLPGALEPGPPPSGNSNSPVNPGVPGNGNTEAPNNPGVLGNGNVGSPIPNIPPPGGGGGGVAEINAPVGDGREDGPNAKPACLWNVGPLYLAFTIIPSSIFVYGPRVRVITTCCGDLVSVNCWHPPKMCSHWVVL